jgi:hypothetical protein
VTLFFDQTELTALLDGMCRDDGVAAGPIFVVEASPPVALLRHCCLMRLCEEHDDLYCVGAYSEDAFRN